MNLQIQNEETLALVGESGCGKSVTALSILRLVETPPGVYESGSVQFEGQDLLRLPEEKLLNIRGNKIGMIFQEPMTSLNPIFTVGYQIAETLILHRGLSTAEARREAISLLRQVAISAPENRIDQYPHELSGGMKQRIMIAMALACKPALMIADEPTTALDVTIQAQIMRLLENVRKQMKAALLLITHNLGIVAQFADRVAVMYAGKIIEEASVEELFENPAHPYTKGLLNSIPTGDPTQTLTPITGAVPHPAHLPEGCAFHPRCPDAFEKCRSEIPPAFSMNQQNTHRASCWLHEKIPHENAL